MFRRGANRASLDALSEAFSRFPANATSITKSSSIASSSSSSSSPTRTTMKSMMENNINTKEESALLGFLRLLLRRSRLLLAPIIKENETPSLADGIVIIRRKRRERGRNEEAFQPRRTRNCLRRLVRRPRIKYENQRKEKS